MVQQTYRDSTGDYSTRQIYRERYSGPKGDITERIRGFLQDTRGPLGHVGLTRYTPQAV